MSKTSKCKSEDKLPKSVLKARIAAAKRLDLVSRKLGFDLGLYDPGSGYVYILNATAAVVWENLTANRSYWDVSSGVALSYGLEKDDAKSIAKDIHGIIARWKNDGLFETGAKPVRSDTKNCKQPEIPFPEREVSRISSEYQRPNYSKFTVDQLQERYRLEEYPVQTPFADVWI
jgi:hypothetical protein